MLLQAPGDFWLEETVLTSVYTGTLESWLHFVRIHLSTNVGGVCVCGMMVRSTKASSCVQIMLLLDLHFGYTNVFNLICALRLCVYVCVCVKYFKKKLKNSQMLKYF